MANTNENQAPKSTDAFESIDEGALGEVSGGGVLGNLMYRTLTTTQPAAQLIRNAAHPVTVLNNIQTMANRFRSFIDSRR